jgi:hypothetical protein
VDLSTVIREDIIVDEKPIDKLTKGDVESVNSSIDATCLEEIERIRQGAIDGTETTVSMDDLQKILIKWIIVRSSYQKVDFQAGIGELGEAIVESTRYVVEMQNIIVNKRDVLLSLLKKIILDIIPDIIQAFYDETKIDREGPHNEEEQLFFQEKTHYNTEYINKEEIDNYITHTKEIIERKL